MKPTVISVYTGIGGLDFGFEAAGFRTAVALELDETCCKTIRLNRRWPVIEGDVHATSSANILHAAGLRCGEADVLIGGPPCQPFSKSGYWATGDSGRLDDPRSDTLSAYLRVLRDARPKAFLLENVRGLAYEGKDEGLQLLLQGIQEVNREARTRYRVSWATLNAADYGVPQLRERVFLVGSRDGSPFVFPEPTHAASGDTELFSEQEPHRTAWDALGDLPQDTDDPALTVGGRWGALLPTVPEGENYLWHTNRGGGHPIFGWRRRYWSFLLKLAKCRPAWTIQAQPGTATGPFHWKSRRLSAQELCRLQTFPEGLRFDCGRSDVQRMLGNAVPSLVAEILAREIRRQILGHRVSRCAPKLMPPRRSHTPPPEKIASLPPEYEAMIGDHEAHPGTGKGYARRAVGSRGVGLVLAAVALLATIPACVDTRTDEVTGEVLYRRYCASCHATSGRGDGPLAGSLAPPPTDLTRLASRAGGKLDEAGVMMAIDGRRVVAQHGPRDMPVWGAVFAEKHVGEPFAMYGPTLDARALADYLRTIQRE